MHASGYRDSRGCNTNKYGNCYRIHGTMIYHTPYIAYIAYTHSISAPVVARKPVGSARPLTTKPGHKIISPAQLLYIYTAGRIDCCCVITRRKEAFGSQLLDEPLGAVYSVCESDFGFLAFSSSAFGVLHVALRVSVMPAPVRFNCDKHTTQQTTGRGVKCLLRLCR